MSTLWTPGGERPVAREPSPASQPPGSRPPEGPGGGEGEPSPEEMEAQMAELRERLAATPAEVVIANHAFGLFELAALHLSLDRPQLEQARLAIDALGALVEGLGTRLGEHTEELNDGLAQLRMAFVQIQGALRAQPAGEGQDRPSPGGGAG